VLRIDPEIDDVIRIILALAEYPKQCYGISLGSRIEGDLAAISLINYWKINSQSCLQMYNIE